MTEIEKTVDQHPEYMARYPDWVLMHDVHEGERTIKDAGRVYLPATEGQILDGMANVTDLGYQNYMAYKSRARFPEFVSESVRGAVGIMHHRMPTIELPPIMEPMRNRATVDGEPLHVLLRKINEQQLIYGRGGLLADVPTGQSVSSARPYIALYGAKAIVNWDDGAVGAPTRQVCNLIVLDESENVRQSDFSWKWENKFRVLVLGDLVKNESRGLYRTAMMTHETGFTISDALAFVVPSIGGRDLDEIPFVFFNAVDLVPTPDRPPLLGLANLSVGVYRSEADYRQSLFMQGQDTLVIIGGMTDDNETRTGTGSKIEVGLEGDAKFIGVNSAGLNEQRVALENDRQLASEMGNKLLDTRGRESESGDALRMRVSARTATLNQIALTGAQALQDQLRVIARWLGADDTKVLVKANQEFTEDTPDGQTLLQIAQAKQLGLPWSSKSVHTFLRERGLTRMSFEEEQEEIDNEEPIIELPANDAQ